MEILWNHQLIIFITFVLVALWITFLAPGLFARMGLSINLGDRLQ